MPRSCSIATARVVAFNAAARVIAPALARGAPASLALRVPEVVEAVREVAAGGGARSVEFAQRVPVDRWFMAHVRPLGDAPPAATILLVFHDLTPLHRVEEMRADFVANASHELRTPLAALSGFIDTLQGTARDDAQARARFLAIMKTQATRMARLIDDLLSLSRVELTEHMHPETPVDLFPVVRQVVDGLQTLATDRGVEIAIAPPAAPAIVPGDRDELTRVFENLVENALKYGASGKRVEIGFTAADRLGRRARSAGRGARLRPGHRGRAPAAPDRALLSRRRHAEPRRRRHRARPLAGQAHPQSPPRQALDRERGRQGRGVHRAAAAGAQASGR